MKKTFLLIAFLGLTLCSKSQVTAAFLASDTVGCGIIVVHFTNLSTGNFTSYFWDFGDGSTSSLWDPAIVYTSPGLYTVSLIVSDGVNVDTAFCTITIYSNPVVDFSADVTSGYPPLDVLFTDLSYSEDSIVSRSWDLGDGVVLNNDINPSHVFLDSGYYSVSLNVVDNHGCGKGVTKFDYIHVEIAPLTEINGRINYLSNSLVSGHVCLYEYSSNSLMQIIDTSTIDSAGFYQFLKFPYGQYIIKAFPNEIATPNVLPTYYGNKNTWDSSVVVSVFNDSIINNIDIDIICLPVLGGSDIVRGFVFDDLDVPLDQVHVLLELVNDSTVSHTYSDTTGSYELISIPSGTYHILIDLPGLPMDSAYTVTIGNGTIFDENNYIVTDSSIIIDQSQTVFESQYLDGSKIYPNPVSDFLTIELETSEVQLVQIFDLYGSLIIKERLLGQMSLNLSMLTSGMYILEVYNKKKYYRQKLIKE